MKEILLHILTMVFLLMFAMTSFLWIRRNVDQDGATVQTRSLSFNIESSPTGIHVSIVAGAPDTNKNWSPVSTWHDTWAAYTEIANGRPVQYRNVWHPPREHIFGFQWERLAFSNGDTAWSLVVPYPAVLLLTASLPTWRVSKWRRRARGFEVRVD